jgi:hypothetical protein
VGVVTDPVPARPKHVVMVDAENPMVEVHGEFFWREDHDRILTQAREAAYRDGYTTGWTAAVARASVQAAAPQRVELAWRRPLGQRIVARALYLLVVLTVVASILLTLAEEILRLG